MKKYYIVSAKRPCSETIEIKVTDNKNGYNVLMEIEAKNYNEALKRISFQKTLNGETRFL